MSLLAGAQRYDIQTTVIYVGSAARGTPEATAAWTIRRVSLVSGVPTVTAWATNVAWSDRTTATYT